MFSSRSGYSSLKKVGFLLLFMGGTVFAQEQKGGSALPILNTPKSNYGLLQPEEKNEDYSFLDRPKPAPPMIFDEEQFIDPGKKYLKKLKREGSVSKDTYLGDVYLGDIITVSSHVKLLLRDFGVEDGDHVRAFINDKEFITVIPLKNTFFELQVPLKEGFNKMDFMALNQGALYPNTAELRMYDVYGNLLLKHNWNLSTGSKATVILVKEGNVIKPE